MNTKKKITTVIIIIVAIGLVGVLWPKYGDTLLGVARAETCRANDGSGNAVAALAQVVCGQEAQATPEWVEMSGVSITTSRPKATLMATKIATIIAVDLPGKSTPTAPVKKARRVGTALPSATPYPATVTPGPPQPTATMRSSAGAGIIGTQKTPCRLIKDAHGHGITDCKTVVDSKQPTK